MQSDDINDDKEDSKSKPMSIYYEATSDISPENIILGEMIDQTPANSKELTGTTSRASRMRKTRKCGDSMMKTAIGNL
jgi:hypothetical protein